MSSRNLSFIFQAIELTRWRSDVCLFEHINIQLDEGELLLVMGDNGAGKTSLLRILCGLDLFAEGQVLWRQQPLRTSTTYFSEMIYVGHNNGIKGDLTVKENIHFEMALYKEGNDEDNNKALLQTLALLEYEHTLARALSAGQQRRLALSRLFRKKAKIWILDEPFSSLDKQGIQMIMTLLTQHIARGGLAIITTHQDIIINGINIKHLRFTK